MAANTQSTTQAAGFGRSNGTHQSTREVAGRESIQATRCVPCSLILYFQLLQYEVSNGIFCEKKCLDGSEVARL